MISLMNKVDETPSVEEKFKYKNPPDGSTNKNAVFCTLWRKEFAYHRSTSTLHYLLNTKYIEANLQVGNMVLAT